MLTVVLYGDPVLRKKSDPIEKPVAVRKLAARMIDCMKNQEGVGLAAPQIGQLIRMAVISHPVEMPKPLTMINPAVLERSDELGFIEEGCLSVPRVTVSVARPRAVRIRYTDLKGRTIEREFLDLLARIVLHECDHLDGKLIVDHMDIQTRLKFEASLRKPAGKKMDNG